MTDMLVELIENFIGGSESTLNSLFNGMLNVHTRRNYVCKVKNRF